MKVNVVAIHGCLLTQSSADNRYRELLIVGVFFLGVAFIISIDSQMELAVRDGVRRICTLRSQLNMSHWAATLEWAQSVGIFCFSAFQVRPDQELAHVKMDSICHKSPEVESGCHKGTEWTP